MISEALPTEYQRFPSHWKILPFSEAFEDKTGGQTKIQKGDYLNDGLLPIVDQGQSLFGGFTNDPDFVCKIELPCILFGDHTKIFKFIENSFALGADGVKVLKQRSDIDPKFAFHYLNTLTLPDVGYSRHFRFLKRTFFPLPPLEEQRRIAAILDKADAVRRKRQKAIALTKELLRSAFLEMFGDPVTNPKGWNVVDLKSQVVELRYGTSVKCNDVKEDGDLPILRIPNIVGEQIYWNDLKYAELEAKEVTKLLLKPGDLLFVRTNGNPEYIGRCALFEEGYGDTLYASYLIRARLKPNALLYPAFIRDTISFPTYRSHLVREARTTAGNYNINTEGLNRLRLIEPPLKEQEIYSNFSITADTCCLATLELDQSNRCY